MHTVLITRPAQEAEELAAKLVQKGLRAFCEPLLSVEVLHANATALARALAAKPQAILVTSRRAVEALAAMSIERGIPLLAVGAATAHYAGALGFRVAAHGETAQALVTLAMQHSRPGQLIYARGEDIRTDIAAALSQAGFQVDSVVLYRATPARAFSPRLSALIAEGGIGAVLFFSRRTAEAYAHLAGELATSHRTMRAICMSEAVAEPLAGLPWQSVLIAAKPDTEHMLLLLP